MRKNQIRNRRKRKERNQLKAPVFRTRKKLEAVKHSIRTNILCILIFGFLSVLFFLSALMDYHSDWWQKSEIIYQNHYYIRRTVGVRGTSTGPFYIITDVENMEWRIPWAEDFERGIFETDVKQGDTLQISWHYWFVGRVVESLESENYTYRSFAEAEAIALDDIGIMMMFGCMSALPLIIAIRMLIGNIREQRQLKEALKVHEKRLAEHINDEVKILQNN